MKKALSGIKVSLIKVIGFTLFATCCLSILLLNSVMNFWARLLLALPVFFFIRWLASRVFIKKHGWRTAQSGFAISRIIFGTLLTLAIMVFVFELL